MGDVAAEEIVRRDAKEYDVRNGRRLCVAQIETVGRGLLTRKVELLGAMEDVRERMDYVVMALMVTDIVEKGTELLAAGDIASVERAFGVPAEDGVLDLPGVMSRKKQVAPRLLSAF